ncbi:MAG TPA: glucose-6-phosphate dehydrogenase [Candidatus Eisenbacteria bacterium]
MPTLPNPLREGLPRERMPDPATLVIFGATGDLTRRKLVPAVFRLFQRRHLPPGFLVMGVSRTELDDTAFRAEVTKAIAEHVGEDAVQSPEAREFATLFHYIGGDFATKETWPQLGKRLAEIESAANRPSNRLFYLATPPAAFAPILEGLAQSQLVPREARQSPWARVVVEKPFGHDLESARALNRLISTIFDESQIYRIDHYLGKETVQNILVLRFGNGIFEPLWNRRHVDHVQITVAEEVGVEQRAGYYEKAGVLRDMLQNHLMQLVSLVAMEPPVPYRGEPIRDEKVKVIRALKPLAPADVATRVVRGQYAAGSIDGASVPAYRAEPGVNPESKTETWLAARLEIDNWRWGGVPFYVRSGKRMPRRATEIAIQFKAPPQQLFESVGADGLSANVLALRIQPDEGIALRFGAKRPGPDIKIQPVKMDFLYGSSFGTDVPDAYDRLLLDALLGDPSLFIRRDEIEGAWAWVQPILDAWAADPSIPLHPYDAGHWGPPEADRWIQADGREWRHL